MTLSYEWGKKVLRWRKSVSLDADYTKDESPGNVRSLFLVFGSP